MNERAGGNVILPGMKRSARAIDPRLTSRAKVGIAKKKMDAEVESAKALAPKS